MKCEETTTTSLHIQLPPMADTIPEYRRYTQIMYILYTNNIKLPSHVWNVLQRKILHNNIYFGPAPLAAWMAVWLAAIQCAQCFQFWSLVNASRRECVQWLVYCGFNVFCVYLRARRNLIYICIYVPKHRGSNYYIINVRTVWYMLQECLACIPRIRR